MYGYDVSLNGTKRDLPSILQVSELNNLELK